MLVDPFQFGLEQEPIWYAAANLLEAGRLVEAYWQHRAVIVVRDRIASSALTQKDIAAQLGTSGGMLSGKLNGRYPLGGDELFRWTLAFDDVTLLPPSVDDVSLLLPTRTAEGKHHRFERLHIGAVVRSAVADRVTVLTSDPRDMTLVAGTVAINAVRL